MCQNFKCATGWPSKYIFKDLYFIVRFMLIMSNNNLLKDFVWFWRNIVEVSGNLNEENIGQVISDRDTKEIGQALNNTINR